MPSLLQHPANAAPSAFRNVVKPEHASRLRMQVDLIKQIKHRAFNVAGRAWSVDRQVHLLQERSVTRVTVERAEHRIVLDHA